MSMGFPRQESWSGLPFPSPGDFCEPGLELMSPALAGRFLTTEPPGSPLLRIRDPIVPYKSHFSDHMIWFGIQRLCPSIGLICRAFLGTWLQIPRRDVGDGKERQMKEKKKLPPSSQVLISDSLIAHCWVGLWKDAGAFSPRPESKG